MSLKPETIAQIQTMLQADPALLAQIQSLSQPNDAADVIAKAATAKGIEVSAAEMAAHFESAAPQGAMSDAELEQVAGGGMMEAIAGSILSLGVMCALISANAANFGNDCGKLLRGEPQDQKMGVEVKPWWPT